MAIIKSALEIALEKTQGVAADKEALEANKYAIEGRKAASRFLSTEIADLKETIAAYQGKQKEWVKDGIRQVLMANVKLPADEMALKNIKRATEGLFALSEDPKRLGKIMSQAEHFFTEYLEERKRLEEAIDRQYAPRLRQKEEELGKKLGSRVRIDPTQDPEYLKLRRQNMTLLDERYGQVLEQVKAEIQKITE